MADKQRLVLSIIDFLKKSIEDGSVKQDDKEGLEVAMQCIGEAFGVDPSDQKQCDQLSIKPANLQAIFDVFLKTKEKVGSDSTTSPSATSLPSAPLPHDKDQAEKLKQSGNSQMSSKNYDLAIDSYTQAIALDPTNPVFYSNRAAAHSSKGDHLSAVGDAEKAIAVDPSFVKAYHRLGHAQYSIGDFKAAASAFKRGLDRDPMNTSLKSGLQNAQVRIVPDDEDDEGPPPLIPDDGTSPSSNTGPGGVPGAGAGPGGMADMLRNFGGAGAGAGAGAGGGMPDIASLMNNPMMMQMAQQMMANGGMERLMQNPAVANMMNRVQSGGGMPSMDEIMADPSLRNLATQFGAGGV